MHELTKATTDREMIRNELLGIFVAGRDTTSALLGNLFFHLARHPQIFQRLRDEVGQLGGKIPSIEDLKLLKYLNGCINECQLAKSFTRLG